MGAVIDFIRNKAIQLLGGLVLFESDARTFTIRDDVRINLEGRLWLSSKTKIMINGTQVHINSLLDERGEPLPEKPRFVPYSKRPRTLRIKHRKPGGCKCHQ